MNQAFINRLLARQPRENFIASLKTVPAGKAEVWYCESNPETWLFAISIREGLVNAGWSEPELKAIAASRFGADLPLFGVTIFNEYREERFVRESSPSAPKIMADFLKANGVVDMRLAVLLAGLNAAHWQSDASLADGEFRIVIAPRLARRSRTIISA